MYYGLFLQHRSPTIKQPDSHDDPFRRIGYRLHDPRQKEQAGTRMNAAKVRNVSRMSDLQLLRALRAGDAVRAGGLVINWNGEAFAVAAGGPSFTLDADAADEIRRVLSLSRAVAITMSRWQKVSSDVYASGPWRIQRLSRGWRWYHVVRFGPTRDLCGKVVTLAEAKHECETANSVLQKEGL